VWGLHALTQSQGQAVTFNLCGIIAILGLFLTIFFTPETMGKRLVEERTRKGDAHDMSMDTQDRDHDTEAQEMVVRPRSWRQMPEEEEESSSSGEEDSQEKELRKENERPTDSARMAMLKTPLMTEDGL